MLSRDAVAPILLAALVAGCASSNAPPAFLPNASEAQWNPRGGWITVRYGAADPGEELDGELLAVEEDSLYVLTNGGPRSAPITQVRRAELWRYGSEYGGLAAWTVLGALSTASNGYYAGITLPLWILGGTISTAGQSRAPRLTRPGDSWTRFRAFARFPQGLPPNLDRSALRPW